MCTRGRGLVGGFAPVVLALAPLAFGQPKPAEEPRRLLLRAGTLIDVVAGTS